MDKCRIGMLAISKAGRDMNHLYVIIGTNDEYVYLVDGKNRPLEKAKKKKKKHIQPIYRVPEDFLKISGRADQLRNEEIRRMLKLYNRENAIEAEREKERG